MLPKFFGMHYTPYTLLAYISWLMAILSLNSHSNAQRYNSLIYVVGYSLNFR